jgi:hypothetical protein
VERRRRENGRIDDETDTTAIAQRGMVGPKSGEQRRNGVNTIIQGRGGSRTWSKRCEPDLVLFATTNGEDLETDSLERIVIKDTSTVKDETASSPKYQPSSFHPSEPASTHAGLAMLS